MNKHHTLRLLSALTSLVLGTSVFAQMAQSPLIAKSSGVIPNIVYVFDDSGSMSAQAIPSYAPQQAQAHFNKVECFCFNQYTLEPGEKKSWPVVFVIDPKLSRDVRTITLSYTFFEVGGKTPVAPVSWLESPMKPAFKAQL